MKVTNELTIRSFADLPYAKKLAELGIPQDQSTHYWCEHDGQASGDMLAPKSDHWLEEGFNDHSRVIHPKIIQHAAFSTDQLGIMLLQTELKGEMKYTNWNGKHIQFQWTDEEGNVDYNTVESDTEANARATLVIWMITEGVLNPKRIKLNSKLMRNDKMKVRNSKTLAFNLGNNTVTLRLTPKKFLTLGERTLIRHTPGGGWSSHEIVSNYDASGDNSWTHISGKVARVLMKYTEFVKEDLKYNYFRLPFDKYEL